MVASNFRSDDNVLIDPRKPWSSQTPEKLALRISDDSWLVPSRWSPDGQRLIGAVMNRSGSPVGIGVYEFSTKKARLVSNDAGAFFEFAWLGDSRRALLIAESNMILIDVESGRRKVLPSGQLLGSGLAISPDRKTIYVSVVRLQADIWVGAR